MRESSLTDISYDTNNAVALYLSTEKFLVQSLMINRDKIIMVSVKSSPSLTQIHAVQLSIILQNRIGRRPRVSATGRDI